jgi:ParB family chromosome partitioning protein
MSLGFSHLPSPKRKEERESTEIRLIPVNSVVFSPFQARRGFEEDDLRELAQSIKEHGVLQPVLVRPFNKGFELIAGERRVRACKMLGLQHIPAVVRTMDDNEVALVGLVENLQRQDLSPIEEAEGYRRLIEEFGLTQEAVAQRVGRSQPTVANKLRLLRLPEEIREAISREIITERHARALLSMKVDESRDKAFRTIVEKGLNVQQAEAFIDEVAASLDGRKPITRKRIHVVRDIRIFLNTFRQAVRALKRAGLDAVMEESDEGDVIRVVVTLSKSKQSEKQGILQIGEHKFG